MTEKEIKSKITQAHTDGYNRGFAKAEEKIADLKANFDYVLEGKDLEIKELKDRLAEEVELHLHAEEYIKSLEQQIEKMKNGDNCKYGCMACGNYICDLGQDNCNTIPFHCDKWELED